MKLSERRKLLIPIDNLNAFLHPIATEFSAQFDSLGPRVAGDLALLDDPAEIIDYLFKDTRNARSTTADRILEAVSILTDEADQFYLEDSSGDCGSTESETGS